MSFSTLESRLLPLRSPRGPLAWLIPALLAVLGGVMRFIRLDFPNRLVFDETYYVKDAYSLTRFGYEKDWPDEPNPAFESGDTSIILDSPSYVVHPPLGKWILGAGIELFGADSSFGWRFGAALVGALSIFLLARIAILLFSSVWIGSIAGLLLAVDGEHFVHSRTGLLDIFLMFFILLGFGCLVRDREWARRRLAERMEDHPAVLAAQRRQASAGFEDQAGADRADAQHGGTPAATDPLHLLSPRQLRGLAGQLAAARRWLVSAQHGPGLGWRPWRLAAGVSLGLAMGVKWSGLYALAVFGILTVLWDVAARRQAGIARPWRAVLVKDAVPAFLSLVPVAFVVYVLCWLGWILNPGGWDREWAADNEGWWSFLPDWLAGLGHYHYTAYTFHVGLDSEHPYMSNPWGWIVQWRPTSFFYESVENGQAGCTVEKCSQAITSLGNPVIWGLAPVAIIILLGAWLLRRDWRAGGILAGLAATWGPWFFYQDRTIFTFYTIVMVPFVVLAVAYCLGLLWGETSGDRSRPDARLLGRRLAVAGIVAAAILVFAWFYPIYTGQLIPHDAWRARMWNPTWV
ncbi:phospholipid carrier-dependent glycosyltransferase [uncultured Brevibacterium sp.]|uniref:dolichyl-phosphate-mannose--protein mannosyltransferase n=1 Tax=uncultured Brevibacterium sp. TaxID=189678 RepID=UPI0025E2152F|nr:phospholipid carrier-dependent glycosyltransferase [uncultured Brevibacterium sp.]